MKKSRSFLGLWGTAVLAAVLFAQPANAQDFDLFQNYFGTLDYSVNGTGGTRGTGKLDPITNELLIEKKIKVDFPASADLVAAFLYWETVEKTNVPSSARGYLSYPTAPNARVKILGKPVGADHAAPCWSNGGSTGSSSGAPTLRVYRADILRYLKAPGSDTVASEITVRLEDSGGNGSKVPLTEGASLILVYRHPALSFKSIVIFDGTRTLDNQIDFMDLSIKGFYQASPGAAKLTHIVGNGQSNFPERLFFNGQLLETNPFRNGWDDKTYDVSSLLFPPGQEGNFISTATTRVDHGSGSFDCISWGAVVFSTTVKDKDEDGLLDIWETQGGGYRDLSGNLLLDLYAMGARANRKDLLVEIDYMHDEVKDSGGNVVSSHSHLPRLEALEKVWKAFDAAPVSNPEGARNGINVIFDVGNNYQGSPYVLSTGARKGGDRINERWPAVYCTNFIQGPPQHCLFPNQPGVISWKKGVQHIKNNYFSDDRSNLFHYVLFGHQLATRGPEAVAPYSGRSVSGRADLPGNTVVVALGRWRSGAADALVGSANMQAATLFHELAHNLWGFHGGITKEFTGSQKIQITDFIVSRPNCNNKQSSLNYMYQSAGLLDAQGVFQINLSGDVLTAPLEELRLNEAQGLGAGPNLPYRLRWYAPLANVQNRFQKRADGTSIPLQAARSYCDGSNTAPIVNSGMVRVDGNGVPGNALVRIPVDWNYNGTTEALTSFQDINFNGRQDVTEDLRGFNDWKSIIDLHGLQQVGAGRNLFSLSLGVVSAHLLRQGEDDLGEDDLGEDDLGEDDLGEDDLGEDDLGEDDLGEDDLGEDDLGEDDLGEIGDLDEPLAIAIGGNGPTALSASVPNGPRRVILNWSAPAFGEVISYTVYRATGTGTFAPLAGGPSPPTATTFTDTTVRNEDYTYVVIATFADGTLSNPSNAATASP